MSKPVRNPYIGHPSQLMRINDYKMTGGFAEGLRATDIDNGEIRMTVLADRGMDFPYVSYKGVNLGFIAGSGMVGPSFYDNKGTGFLRGFNSGFLTTCGIVNMGAACEYEGAHYGLHGRISYTPAEEYRAHLEVCGDSYSAHLSGVMRQAVLFGEHMTMRRDIRCDQGEKGFRFTDTVVNHRYKRQEHMILYHFNMGYPLLDESAELLIPARSSVARDPHAESGYDERLDVPKPVRDFAEMCYFYDLKRDAEGKTFVGIYNHGRKLGVTLAFDTVVLDHFTQWKMVGEGEYTIGLEPGNATPNGIAAEMEAGNVKFLEPGEERSYSFTVSIIDGDGEWAAAKTKADALA